MTPDVSSERRFEQEEILGQRERYLATDVLDKLARDAGYREKVDHIDQTLGGVADWVLDLGANTCGESECLTTRGYRIVASDINEYALGISKQRAALYGRESPSYVAADAHRLPFADESFACGFMYESLHHMPDPAMVLGEVRRVLKPGGKLFLYEPYAYNPYRRLAEVKDRLKRSETVERSFGVRQLRRLVADAGLEVKSFDRVVNPPSDWKMEAQSRLHGLLKRIYFKVSIAAPWLFGNLAVVAEKPGVSETHRALASFESLLRCPATGRPLSWNDGALLEVGGRFRYPMHEGIPVLVAEDAVDAAASSVSA
jgi:SAM-dependent methyltransferase